MKTKSWQKQAGPAGRRERAFTLIEMLVVIGVIGILAGMVLGGLPGVARSREIKKVTAELKRLEMAIDAYHAKFGTYPPESTTPTNHALFYELTGVEVIVNSTNPPRFDYHSTVNGRTITVNNFTNALRLEGVMNVTYREVSPPLNATQFLDVSKSQYATLTNQFNQNLIYSVLTVPAKPAPFNAITNRGKVVVPWKYVVNQAVHNPGKYDLSATFMAGRDVITIGNWKN
jgi:prepilin-type N-terminal cleavage/methylation domain-containing protein